MKLTLIFGILFLLAIILLVTSGALRPDSMVSTPTDGGNNEITYSGNSVTTPLPEPSGTMQLTLASGQTIAANDFRRIQGVEMVGEGLYSLNGLPGDQTAPTGFFFNDDNDSFAVAITAKPLAANHQAVSLAFKDMLDLPESQLCQLNVYVGVPFDLDPNLSGQDLELSFCPGAKSLR